MVCNRDIIHADTKIYSMKSLWGYDKNMDKIINAEIDPSLAEMTIDTCWFTSQNTLETNKMISPYSGDTLRSRYEFKSADLFLFTTINNNKNIEAYKFTRVKK
jgi:hypothetical protein